MANPNENLDTKECSKCHETKSFGSFGFIYGTYRLKGPCKKCESIQKVEWARRNPEKRKEQINRYVERNKEAHKRRTKAWRQKSKGIINASTAKRRYTKMKATPNWLSNKEKEELRDWYIAADYLSRLTTCKIVVDHIIPIQGKNVCGLHVPWNLQLLTNIENIKKGNRYESK